MNCKTCPAYNNFKPTIEYPWPLACDDCIAQQQMDIDESYEIDYHEYDFIDLD